MAPARRQTARSYEAWGFSSSRHRRVCTERSGSSRSDRSYGSRIRGTTGTDGSAGTNFPDVNVTANANSNHNPAVAIDPTKGAADIATPGHIFPLRARDGGVLVRAGHTEAATDVARLAGLNPAGVICEIMNEDGTMARLPDLVKFAQKHALKIGTISDLIAYRRRHDNLVKETARHEVTSAHGGDWMMRIFTDETEGTEHVVLTKGDITTPEPVLVRTHALNVLEDVLGLGPAPEGELARAMRIVAREGRGAVCLFRDPKAKLAVDEGDDRPRTIKQIGLGAQILSSMGLKQLILLTNSPMTRYLGLDAYDLEIVGTRPIAED